MKFLKIGYKLTIMNDNLLRITNNYFKEKNTGALRDTFGYPRLGAGSNCKIYPYNIIIS